MSSLRKDSKFIIITWALILGLPVLIEFSATLLVKMLQLQKQTARGFLVLTVIIVAVAWLFFHLFSFVLRKRKSK